MRLIIDGRPETEEERRTRYEEGHRQHLEQLKQDQFDRDYEHTKNDRMGCTCHACQRMIERGYTKKSGGWVASPALERCEMQQQEA